MNYKDQHWVPKSYLEAWIDPNTPSNYTGYVWRFSKDGSIREGRAPKNIFKESNFYTKTASDGSRDLSIEHTLSTVESKFTSTQKHKLSSNQKLTPEDISNIIAFVSVMSHRTKLPRDTEVDRWNYVLKVRDNMAECIKNPLHPPLSPLQLISRQCSMSHEVVKKIAKEPIASILITASRVRAEILTKMNMHIICAPENLDFITSDHPCVDFDPFYSSKHIALSCQSIEITLPISPKQMVIFFWGTRNQSPEYEYVLAKEKDVNEFNRRTRFFCDEHFIANDKIKNDFWFE